MFYLACLVLLPLILIPVIVIDEGRAKRRAAARHEDLVISSLTMLQQAQRNARKRRALEAKIARRSPLVWLTKALCVAFAGWLTISILV